MFLQTALAAALTLCQPYYDAKLALHGYRSCDGRVAAAPQYTVAERFGKGGIAAVVDAKGWAYINRRGEVVIRPFRGADPGAIFEEHLIRVATLAAHQVIVEGLDPPRARTVNLPQPNVLIVVAVVARILARGQSSVRLSRLSCRYVGRRFASLAITRGFSR